MGRMPRFLSVSRATGDMAVREVAIGVGFQLGTAGGRRGSRLTPVVWLVLLLDDEEEGEDDAGETK